MIEFKIGNADPYGIEFKFYGKKPGKPPAITICRIKIVSQNITVGKATVKVVPEYAVKVLQLDIEAAKEKYDKRIKKIYKINNDYIVVLRGDQFCYETGKLEALKKALKSHNFTKEFKKVVMDAYFEDRRKREEAKENKRMMKLLKERGIIGVGTTSYEPF